MARWGKLPEGRKPLDSKVLVLLSEVVDVMMSKSDETERLGRLKGEIEKELRGK